MRTEHTGTIVIGGGQAGLSTAYHLTRLERDCLVLEGHERVGDIWRNRYDSLRLYSPAKYDGLPGWAFPVTRWTYPTKDQIADYLEAYADRFELPVRTDVSVDTLTRKGHRFVVHAGTERYEADNVVVASGTWQEPFTPDFADQLDPSVRQLHSHDYRNPAQLQDGAVLVVGCSHSGADIAFEVAAEHHTILSGPVHEIPFNIEGRVARMLLPFLWFAANHVLTERTPIGRKVQPDVRAHGGPLLRVKCADLAEAGVEHVPEKVAGVRDGQPYLTDGRVMDVRNVVWCTGFGKDMGWIQVPFDSEAGWPVQERGVVPSQPGLYFVGLPFLYAFTSMLVGGVGRDAERVAVHIGGREKAPGRRTRVAA